MINNRLGVSLIFFGFHRKTKLFKLNVLIRLFAKWSNQPLKGLSQPLPFSMTSKLLIKHGGANSCFAVNCVPEGMFNYLE